MKNVIALMLALTLCLSLVGCGPSAAPSSSVSEPASSSQAQEPAEPSSEPASSSQAQEPAEPSSEPASSSQAQEPAEPAASYVTRVAALKGPTAMGMVQLMKQEETSGAYEFSIFAAIDEVTPKIVKGEVDIAAVPANMAAVLYNNTQGQIRVIGINTLGVLYIVESGDSVGSVADLKGKTLYASGKGATPEYALNYILQQNGLTPGTDVTIEWKSEHAECVAALASDPDGIAMLPQPFVATAQAQNPAIRIALDLTAEWDAIEAQKEAPSALLTGVVVARADYIDAHPQELAAFLSSYDESVGFVNTETEQAAALIEEYGIVAAPVAQAALPYCNIVLIQGAEMKEKLSGYLNVLFEQNPKAVGGSLPDDAFYYGA